MEMILSPNGSINCDIIDEYNPSVQSINFNLCVQLYRIKEVISKQVARCWNETRSLSNNYAPF